MTGLNSTDPNVSDLGAGISFDLSITATSVATPALTVTNHPDGIGVSGGSTLEIENRNNLDPNDDESLVFTINNVTGLAPGQSLRISGIGTRSNGTTEKQYAISDGTSTISSGSFNTSPFAISVPNLASAKITAVGPTSSTALNSRFIVHELLLTITGGDGKESTPNSAAKVTNTCVDGSGHPFFTFDSVAGESYEIQCSTDIVPWTPIAILSGTGSSIGAGMTNRLLIELDGAAFQNAGTQVSQIIKKCITTDSFGSMRQALTPTIRRSCPPSAAASSTSTARRTRRFPTTVGAT